jgi:hypothetical protein
VKAHFEISKLSDVNWNDRALENLVLGQGEKKVITALISSKQARGKRSFDDFIQGKGKTPLQLFLSSFLTLGSSQGEVLSSFWEVLPAWERP